MWTASELEDLSVWADDLQRRGDPWGELVATSLAAAASEHSDHRTQLEARVAELERDVLQPRVQPLLDGFTGIRTFWEHGVLVGLRVTDPSRRSSEALLERMAALLRLPAARFLWLLRVELWTENSRGAHLDVLPLLLAPEIVARPRVLILGSPTRHVTRLLAAHHLGEAAEPITDPARGLLDLIVSQSRVELPWARGDKGTRRYAFARLDARVRTDPTRLSARDRTSLARALWDRSLRVRLGALDCLGTIGVEAAPLIPDLLLINRGAPQWRERAGPILAKLAAQPEIVARVAENFLAEQVGATRWLRSVDELDPRGVERIAAMIRERDQVPGWLLVDLIQTHRCFRPSSELDFGSQFDSGSQDLGSQDLGSQDLGSQELGTDTCNQVVAVEPSPTWFQRLRGWLNR